MSPLESIRDSLADIGRQDFPVLAAPPGPWSYRVGAVRADGRCDLVAVKEGPPPELPNVDHWCGSGASSKPVLGSLVVVSFLDGDAAQPMINAYTPLRFEGGAPTLATLDATTIKIGPTEATSIALAGTGPAVARVGDTVSLGYLAATANIMTGVVAFVITPTDPAPIPSAHLTGVVTSGSAKVTSG